MTVLLWWVAGCPKKESGPGVSPDVEAPLGARNPTTPVTGPTRVVRPSRPRLCIDVPSGWSGTTTDGDRFLEIHRDDGYAFAVTIGRDQASSAERQGYTLLFDDAGTYRHPGVLPDAGTRSWTAIDPAGGMIRAWYGAVDGVPVEISVTYPLGGVTAGDLVFAPLLDRFCSP